ncbi:transposase family protein [Myceligenerans xiligouense]|uniref:transposase family protein n=1 Tax=Myceligenerans xiligouense TaxID=253184 RepID=UPI00147691BA|nr:transposase family protein [Myceligenerans xiligouense]
MSALLEALEAVPDPRDLRGVVYDLAILLGLGVFAAACQATTFDEIAETVRDADAYVFAGFGLMTRRVPSLATLGRVLCDVDPDALDETLSAWACDMKPAPTAGR